VSVVNHKPGYLSPLYGQSFSEFGEIITLPESGAQFIRREITSGLFDYIGVYPFVMCKNWQKLHDELNSIRSEEDVSVVFVVDPFSAPDACDALADWEVCRKFKSHFVVNLEGDWLSRCNENCRRSIRTALSKNDVELVADNNKYVRIFFDMYSQQADRVDMPALQRLSLRAVEEQVNISGCDMFVSSVNDIITGVLIVYDISGWANSHLVATTDSGRKMMSTFALYEKCFSILKDRGRKNFNFGGAVGLTDDPSDGVFRFKSRWGGNAVLSCIFGKILNYNIYEELTQQTLTMNNDFFPAYRAPGSNLEWNTT